jgi:SAM-dependent methyltransferase
VSDLRTIQPPEALAARVGGAPPDYHDIGSGHARVLRSVLPDDWGWEGKRVLDFGCGPGRTMVQFTEEAAVSDWWGCDIDRPTIEWAQENLSPPFSFLANDEDPPLSIESGTVDLVYAWSVFTHLVDSWSAWVLELHRIMSVGGLGVVSFLGEGMIEYVADHPWDEDRVGMIGLDIGKPWSIGGPNVLMSSWWIRAHWGRAFEICEIRPSTYPGHVGGHGLIIFRKDDRPAPTREELEALEPDEPREIASMRFAIELLGKRVAEFWQERVEGIHPLQVEIERLRAQLEGR